jgi:hypothetical protein
VEQGGQKTRVFVLKSLVMASAVLALTIAPLTAAAQTTGWTAAPGAAPSDAANYVGVIDGPANGATVSNAGAVGFNGWFVDQTAQGWAGADQVQVFLGQMGSGGTMLAEGVVGLARPDVATALGNPWATNSGWFVSVPGSSLPAGAQTLNVYLRTPGKGWFYKPVNVTVSSTAPPSSSAPPASGGSGTASGAPLLTVTAPTEGQNVSTRSDFTITGTASTPGIGPHDIDRVQVYINGERDSGTFLGETTPDSNSEWSVGFTPTHFGSTHSNIYVYAHSKSTGQETETVRGFNIVDK